MKSEYDLEQPMSINSRKVSTTSDPYALIQQFREELPIFYYKKTITDMLLNNNIVLITGETGSGKSTQLPQYVYDSVEINKQVLEKNIENGNSPIDNNLNIVITQPRRVAAISMAKRIAFERGTAFINDYISYTIRFDDRCTDKTRLRYMTDGILVRECIDDPMLNKYHIVILDEAHERQISTDILFSLCKEAVRKRNGGLKLIVTSATMDTNQFSDYFDKCPVQNMEGKCYPVELLWGETSTNSRVHEAVKAAIRMHLHEDSGDVLAFLTGSEECEMAVRFCYQKLDELIERGKEVPSCLIYALYGSQSPEDQTKVFELAPENTRKIIFSTNIAETSLTIDGIGFVIDGGYVKQKQFNPRSGMDCQITVPISKVQAIQRVGRAGRTQPGKCYRMYSKKVYDEQFESTTVPEILRVNLTSLILKLKCIGIDNVLNFDYVQKPEDDLIVQALKQQYMLDAQTSTGKLTEFGKELCKYPLEPQYSKSLIMSKYLKCQSELLTIVSMLSTENIWKRVTRQNFMEYERLQEKMKEIIRPEGDHYTYLQIYKLWENHNFSSYFAKDNFFNLRALKQTKNIRQQIKDLTKMIDEEKVEKFIEDDPIYCMVKNQPDIVKNISLYDRIAMSLTSAFFYNSARKIHNKNEEYLQLSDHSAVNVEQNSSFSVINLYPEYVIFTELSGQNIIRGSMKILSKVNYEWVEPYLKKVKDVNIKEQISGHETNNQDNEKNSDEKCLGKRKGNLTDLEGKEKLKVQQAQKLNNLKEKFLKRKELKIASVNENKKHKN